nr:DUF4260 family protein [Halobacterium bonnevillei]
MELFCARRTAVAVRGAGAGARPLDARLPRGPRVGSQTYNLAHTYALPAVLGAAGFWTGGEGAVLVALVWAGHIGADRLVGYGLKYESGFKQTHLSTQPAPLGTLAESEHE